VSSKRAEEAGKTKREQKGEDGSRETDRGMDDQLIPNWNKCHRTERNTYSVECSTGGEAGDCRALDGRRSGKAERAIGRKSGEASFLGRPSKN
jgi:hypothetical protein